METIRASEEAAARRGATLEAVAFAAQRLLEVPDWQQVIPEIVERLAEAVGSHGPTCTRTGPRAASSAPYSALSG